MAVLYIILRNLSVILFRFLGEIIRREGLLQEGITFIFLIRQNTLDC